MQKNEHKKQTPTPDRVDGRWFFAGLLGTMVSAMLALYLFTGGPLTLSPGPAAKPEPRSPAAETEPAPEKTAYRVTENDVLQFLTDADNRDRATAVLSAPEMRRPLADILITPEMQTALTDLHTDPGVRRVFAMLAGTREDEELGPQAGRPEPRELMVSLLSRPDTQEEFLALMAETQMRDTVRAMVRDPRLRSVLLSELGAAAEERGPAMAPEIAD